MPNPRTNEALALMTAFAARTGLTGEQPAQRYLWTDAFAVCNFLGLARATGDAHFRVWARELAQTARHAFAHQPSAAVGPPRLYWKMSIDLTRPQLPAMVQHDPLDGYVTYAQLRATAAALPGAVREPSLDAEMRHFAALIEGGRWATADPLGIGGLLSDAHHVLQLVQQGALADDGLLDQLLAAALSGLRAYVESGEYRLPAEYRLAFRDLGLAIGLQAAERMARMTAGGDAQSAAGAARRTQLDALLRYGAIGDAIVSFWRDPANRRATSWTEHRDINEVMLATALAPEGYLDLRPPGL